jgi:outer membrane protein assembly factor BamA
MHKLILVAACLVCILPSTLLARAQQYTPPVIGFEGAPQYKQDELMAAAQLATGKAMTNAEMSEHARLLLETGLFEEVSFRYDAKGLIFQLKPAAELLKPRFNNLPPLPGLDLDATLRQQIPLYHGLVPQDGNLADQLRAAVEKILADHGIPATLLAAPQISPSPGTTTRTFTFTITSPEILLGSITPAADSTTLDAAALNVLRQLNGKPYDVTGSPAQIVSYLANSYHDEAYLEVATEPRLQTPIQIAADAVHVPFTVKVTPGPQYHLSALQMAPGLPIPQREFEHTCQIHSGQLAGGQQLTVCWESLNRWFQNRGYMRAAIQPEPTFDRDHATVAFTVQAQPGPVYSMGKLTVQNSDEVRTAITAAWPLPAGATFDGSAIDRLLAIGNANKPLAQLFASMRCVYQTTLNDDLRTVDVTLRLERK